MFRLILTGLFAAALSTGCGGSSAGPVTKPAPPAPPTEAAPGTMVDSVPPTKPAATPDAKPTGAAKPTDPMDESAAKLKQIGQGMFKSYDVYLRLPPAVMFRSDFKPGQLSWRVAILPFIGEQKLYDQFHRDKPWDSDHNKALIPKMPSLYAPVAGSAGPGETFYQVFVGPGSAFEPGVGISLPGIADGTSTTAEVVEAGAPVVWTKPADLPFDPAKDLPKLGGMFPDEFNVMMCDGHVHRFKRDFDPAEFKKVVTRGAGETIDFTKLQRKVSFMSAAPAPKP